MTRGHPNLQRNYTSLTDAITMITMCGSRYKHLIGPKLRARTRSGQRGEVALAIQVLNRMIREAKPVSVPR